MEIKEGKIKGIFEIILTPKIDLRGFFMRTFDFEIFKEAGLEKNWVQENHSQSVDKGTIRGMHFQFPPYCETKLVRCIRGKILDVYVDLRKGSPTFGHWDSIELSAVNNKMIFIPRGFAHGFCTLSAMSEVLYKVDNYFSPQHECGLLWKDEALNILWPKGNPILSVKDENNLTFREFIRKHEGIEI